MLIWLYYFLLLIVQLAGLVVAIFQLPGLWVMLAGTGVFALLTRSHGYVSVTSILVLLGLAITAEIVEFVAGGAGAKKAGASKLGMTGAMVGGIVGAIVGTPMIPVPIVGTIVGAVVGSFLGAMAVELIRRREVGHSLRVGYGAAKGRLLGIGAKLTIGIIMLLITIVVAFPVGGRATPIMPTTIPYAPLTTLPVTLPANGGF